MDTSQLDAIPNESILFSIERLRKAIGFSEKEWVAQLELTEKQYQQLLAGREQIQLPLLFKLSKNFNFSPEKILTGGLDFEAISAYRKEDRIYIPEKYRKAAFSRKHTFLNIIQHIKERLGWWRVDTLLKRLQIHQDSLKNDLPINI